MNKTIFTAAVLLVLAGCNDDKEQTKPAPGEGKITVTAGIDALTRAPHLNEDGSGYFQDGDKIAIIEVGGTVGDMESQAFLEAIRQFQNEVGKENAIILLVTLIPYLKASGEMKTKPTQGCVRELQSFAQFGSDLDADTKARLAQGERIVEVLKQNRSAPVPVEKQVAILYATIHDHLVKVKVPDVAEYEKGLYEYLDNNAAGAAVMETIRTTGNLDKDTEEQLKSVLTAYTDSFVKAH